MATENYDHLDGFHRLLSAINANFGAGDPIGIVWSTTDTGNIRTGMVICQLQYGMSAKRFKVVVEDGEYTLKFLGKVRHVKSDYFEEMVA